MSNHSGAPREQNLIYRAATTDAVLNDGSITGAPKRDAYVLYLVNANAAAQTAVIKGGDGVSVTIPLAAASHHDPLYGSFSGLGTLGTTVTCIAGWIPDENL